MTVFVSPIAFATVSKNSVGNRWVCVCQWSASVGRKGVDFFLNKFRLDLNFRIVGIDGFVFVTLDYL